MQLEGEKTLIPKYTVIGLILSIPETAIGLDRPDYCELLLYILQIRQDA